MSCICPGTAFPVHLMYTAVFQVCVGATCPEERLHLLLPLLEPGGGKLLAPVDHDLRLYTRTADGSIKHRLISSVRFSDLEVGHSALAGM